VQKSGRRGALKAFAVAGLSAIWAACRGTNSQSSGVIPTLADQDSIRATHAAVPALTVPAVATTAAQQTGASPTSEPSESDATPDETQSDPTTSVPAVKRGPDGILITSPITRFYETRYRTANPRPEINADDWLLTISGWVQYPQALSLDDIKALPQIELMRSLECISNPVGGPLIGNTIWQGVKLGDVLTQAGIRTGASEIMMRAADGYETSIPVELAHHEDALLVFEMNGEPLSVKHGYPVRVLLPGRYGQKQPKWIIELEVMTEEVLGYWEQQGWSNEARVQINSQIWTPPNLSHVSGEQVTISGIAFADERGVSAVEISTDGGSTWAAAQLVHGPDSLVWTEWSYNWTVPQVSQPTSIELAVRATDGNGRTQRRAPNGSGLLNSTFPDGTSDIHRIVVTVESSS
jgi:DMSO/TMAO reductase YedYZ molybdopterin-dependent catalytic subunit